MTKKTTKKIKAPAEKIQEGLVKTFERYCKELLSEKIKKGVSLKTQKTVLLSKKRLYNKRNIIK